MAVVQIFEDSDLGRSELSLVLFPKIHLNVKHSIYLKPVGFFNKRKKKGLSLILMVAGLW